VTRHETSSWHRSLSLVSQWLNCEHLTLDLLQERPRTSHDSCRTGPWVNLFLTFTVECRHLSVWFRFWGSCGVSFYTESWLCKCVCAFILSFLRHRAGIGIDIYMTLFPNDRPGIKLVGEPLSSLCHDRPLIWFTKLPSYSSWKPCSRYRATSSHSRFWGVDGAIRTSCSSLIGLG
jgi:hypothetical protein